MSDSDAPKALLVLKRALMMPLPISLLVGGALWLALLHGNVWGVLGLIAGIAGAAIYTTLKVQDEEFIRESIRLAHERERRTDGMRMEFRIEELDIESRVKMKTIVRLQNEIAEDVDNSPIDAVATGMADTVGQTEELVERSLAMSRKRRELLRYLSKTEKSGIEARIHSLQGKADAETDPARKAELSTSLQAKEQELKDYLAIEESADRVLTQLDSIECSFESLRARLVRIKSGKVDEWTAARQELQTELVGLNTAVDSIEQSISEALSIGG